MKPWSITAAVCLFTVAATGCTQTTDLLGGSQMLPVPGGELAIIALHVRVASVAFDADGTGTSISREVPGPFDIDVLGETSSPAYDVIEVTADTYAAVDLEIALAGTGGGTSSVELDGLLTTSDETIPVGIRINVSDTLEAWRATLEVSVGLQLDIVLVFDPERWLPSVDFGSANLQDGVMVIDETRNIARRNEILAALRASVQASLADGTFGE